MLHSCTQETYAKVCPKTIQIRRLEIGLKQVLVMHSDSKKCINDQSI